MLSRVLSVPFFVIAFYGLYRGWEGDTDFIVGVIIAVLALAAIFIMQPQIDWWWYRRHPPALPRPVVGFLEKYVLFYRRLSPADQLKFRQRTALFMLAKDFKPMAMEQVPDDIKLAVGICAVQLTFGSDEFLLGDYDTFVIYPHPFPSPQFPEVLHHSETFHEDKVFVFSGELLVRGVVEPGQFFNVGIYEMAGVLIDHIWKRPFPSLGTFDWPQVEKIMGVTREQISWQTGLPALDTRRVAVVGFFLFPDRFVRENRELFGSLCTYFRLNPFGLEAVLHDQQY